MDPCIMAFLIVCAYLLIYLHSLYEMCLQNTIIYTYMLIVMYCSTQIDNH